MTEFLLSAAAFVLATVALGLIRILRGPSDADRLLAAQLLGTGGVAALLLLGVATAESAIGDLALVLTLLAAFASVGFVTGTVRPDATRSPGEAPAARAADRPEPAGEETRR
ncbi:MAG: monovalent cation/H+ antiporter complex subunit F [Gammaproteobacteria bacterium]|nr:monovalent cation/H+ antiporter complex subunit F [Gammaproteobacteria bacterium]